MRLENRIALVTGGATGIGLSTAAALAAEGSRVFITGRREEKLREACARLGAPVPVACHRADMSDRRQVQDLVERLIAECGRIDILVVNHGVNVPRRSAREMPAEDWDRIMSINATGAFNLVHAVLPGMRARGDGVIICNSSLSGFRPNTLGGFAYSASKSAMSAMARVIAEEEKDSGVRISVISPGEVNTPILDDRPVPVSAGHRARILQPEDVAAAVVYIATQPPRVHIPELLIKPATQSFV